MRSELVARRVSEARVRIADRVSEGTQFKSRSLDISRRVNDAIPANLPGWARQYLRGYVDALLDGLNRQTDFRYLIGDTWVNAHDLEYANDCRTPDTCAHSGHIAATRQPASALFWKGSDRVFYQSVDMVYGR